MTTNSPPVIPAKAGIQLKASCEALKTFMSCAAHAIFGWIPAFAGMTSGRLDVSTKPCRCP